MTKRDDKSWRQHVIETMLPRLEAANTPEQASFQEATATDFGPIAFHSDGTPDDPTALLDGLPAIKMTALKQRKADLHAAIPSYSEISEVRLSKLGYSARISELMKLKAEGGHGLPESAPQVSTERAKLDRADRELARLETLREVRTARWNAAGQVERNVADWLLRGGVPGNCIVTPIDDLQLSELLKKNETIANGVERFRHRLRELAADLHRLRSSPWPAAMAKAKARELIDRLADQGAPNLDAAIEFGQPISFGSLTLRSVCHNAGPGAVAYAETPDVLGLIAWLFRDQLLAKIDAGLDEIADPGSALNQAQREEMEAQIANDMIIAERSECACIWAAEAKGEVLDFRPDTTPMAALGVALKTVPRAPDGPSTSILAFDVVRGGGR